MFISDIFNLFLHSEAFGDILRASTVVIFQKIKKALETPHQSTGIRPHFWLTVDKATPARNTLQCIIIVSVFEGTKVVYPVGAPQVYKQTETSPEIQSDNTRCIFNLVFFLQRL